MAPRLEVLVESELLAGAKAQTLANGPYESCGLLIGALDGQMIRVMRFAFCANLAESADEFILAPTDHSKVVNELRHDDAIVGVFHSHQGPPTPSVTDLMNMRMHDLIWLIIGNTASKNMHDLALVAYAPVQFKPAAEEIAIRIL